MIGWVTAVHVHAPDGVRDDPEELNAIGIYVEPSEGRGSTSLEIVGARSYEIEAGALHTLLDPQFDDVEWWTYSMDTYTVLVEQCPGLADRLKNMFCSEPIMRLVDFQAEYPETEGPIEWTMRDYELFCAVQGAVNLVGADLTSKIDRLLTGIS